jgi:hypothetical protein
VGGAPAVLAPLSGRRAAWGAALLAVLIVYFEVYTHLWHAGIWWDVAWIAAVLMPAVFALVLCGVPLYESRLLLPVGIAAVLATAVLQVAGAPTFANFTRLLATTALGWWFLGYFETLGWVVLVAAIIPWIDAYSVWRGPTKNIVAHHEHVFTVLSFAFPVPGEHSAANLGVPDLLFFALFLAAAYRFGLRVLWTWVAMLVLLGTTIALTVWLDLNGLPALPAISLGFVLPNADLIWARLRTSRGQPGLGDRPHVAVDRPADDA